MALTGRAQSASVQGRDVEMTRTIALIAVTLGAAALGLTATDAAHARSPGGATNRNATDAFAQARRPRARVRVAPAYPYRLYSTTYPVPYKYESPGPGAVRQCTSWLAPEHRASGPVIVPRMRCWWER
jgi:hypothetical protein